MHKISKEKRKKGLKLAGYGLAGNVAGSVIGAGVASRSGAPLGKSMERGARAGTVAGVAVGGWRQSRHAPPPIQASDGPKAFKTRVGTKTNGRVAKKDHPYTVNGD